MVEWFCDQSFVRTIFVKDAHVSGLLKLIEHSCSENQKGPQRRQLKIDTPFYRLVAKKKALNS